MKQFLANKNKNNTLCQLDETKQNKFLPDAHF